MTVPVKTIGPLKSLDAIRCSYQRKHVTTILAVAQGLLDEFVMVQVSDECLAAYKAAQDFVTSLERLRDELSAAMWRAEAKTASVA